MKYLSIYLSKKNKIPQILNLEKFMELEKKILEKVSATMQANGYGYKTQRTYLKWIKEYILFNREKNPLNLGIREIEHFKKYIELTKMFSYELKKQATQAIFFLYSQVLGVNLQKEYIQSAKNLKPFDRKKKHQLVQSVMVF